MKITLKHLSLLNFKGIRELELEFNDTTTISGANALGKTTIFDAFTWLLFGKDSQDRKEFDIKTYDQDGTVIEKIPHEVSATLLVDGMEMTLRRCYSEKWTKKRGSAVEEFTGHEVTQYVNDVPCGSREYQQKIEKICPENIFKLITNTAFFTNQKKDIQRQLLFDMAGGVSDEDIASSKEAFRDLLSQLTGKTLDEYKREISAKRRLVKEKIILIPARIDEHKRDVPESQDWEVLERERDDKNRMIEQIDNQIMDISKSYQIIADKKRELQQLIDAAKERRNSNSYSVKERVLVDFRAQKSEKSKLVNTLSSYRSEQTILQQAITAHQSVLERLNEHRTTLLLEWKEINSSCLEFKEDEFVCPTCSRTLETDDIDKQKEDMTCNFNAEKSTLLDNNKSIGLQTKSNIEICQQAIQDKEMKLSSKRSDIATIESNEVYHTELIEPNTQLILEVNREEIECCNKITELENQLGNTDLAPDNSELTEGRQVLIEGINIINKELSKRDIITSHTKRITELEQEQRTLAQELATLENIEFTIAEFSKAKTEQIESKINSLFSFVRFRMYDTQINGGEVETCEAICDGVPFSSQNNAMRINMGLDIIGAICKHHDVTAPIFVDNAESVNALLPTTSQLIRLVVSDDSKLIIN